MRGLADPSSVNAVIVGGASPSLVPSLVPGVSEVGIDASVSSPDASVDPDIDESDPVVGSPDVDVGSSVPRLCCVGSTQPTTRRTPFANAER